MLRPWPSAEICRARCGAMRVSGVTYLPTNPSPWSYAICTLRADATVWCTNTLTTRLLTSPALAWSQKLGGATKWTQLVSGGMHLCALNDAQELWCWGHNDDGQVGVSNLV